MFPLLTKLLLSAIQGLLEKFAAYAASTPDQWDDLVATLLLELIAKINAQGTALDKQALKQILTAVQAKCCE